MDKFRGASDISASSLQTVNTDLLGIARLFLNDKGLPERPWFKNQIYAPGAYTGYGVKTLPAIREPLEVRHICR